MGTPSPACATCEGVGKTYTPAPPLEDQPWFAGEGGVAEFLEAWAAIERHGVEGWLALARPPGGASPQMMEALSIMAGELARLEHADRVREAAEDRRKAAPGPRG